MFSRKHNFLMLFTVMSTLAAALLLLFVWLQYTSWIFLIAGMLLQMYIIGINSAFSMCLMCDKRLTITRYCCTCQYRAWAIERTFKWMCSCGHRLGRHGPVGCRTNEGCVGNENSFEVCSCMQFAEVEGAIMPALAKEYFVDMEKRIERYNGTVK